MDACVENKSVFSAGSEGNIIEWNLETTEGNVFAIVDEPIYSLRIFYPHILVGTAKGNVFLFDLKKKKFIQKWELNCGGIFSIELVNEMFWVGCENGTICQIALNKQSFAKRNIANKSIRKILLHNEFVLLACSDEHIYVLDNNGIIANKWHAHQSSIFALAATSTQLLSGGRDAIINAWLYYKHIANIPAHNLHVNDLQIHPDGNLMASCSMDKTIKFWKLPELDLLKVISPEKMPMHTSSINKILWINKNTLISCSDDKKLIQYKIDII